MILGRHSLNLSKNVLLFLTSSRSKEKSWGETCIANNTYYDNSESLFVFMTQYVVLKIYVTSRNILRTAISEEITET